MIIFTRPVRFVRPALVVALVAGLNLVSLAKDAALNYLPVGQPDAATFLPPPPVLGSAEQLAELDEVRAVYHAAGSNDKTAAFFKKVQSDAATVTDTGKDFFQRPRPFVTDPSLKNGQLEKTFSYPSGHSTETMVLGLVLADLFPDKHDDILAHARQMGWHRIQIARHYPTDIYAGRVLAVAIVKELKKSDTFAADFAAAKAEIAAAIAAAKN